MALPDVVQRVLGEGVAEVLFESGNLSSVVGVRLESGREVVIEARPWSERIPAVLAAQRRLFESGVPVPQPLEMAVQVGGWGYTFEEHLPGGALRPPDSECARDHAHLLFRVIGAVSPDRELRALLVDEPLWVRWRHDGPDVWVGRDTPGPDIRVGGPREVREAAVKARKKLHLSGQLPLMLGHADFEAQNIRWQGRTPYVIHDLDSLVMQPEALLVGYCAAVWPAGWGGAHSATVDQSKEFMAAYEVHRGVAFTELERELAWAAGLWVRAFNTRKAAADGRLDELRAFRGELDSRSRLARV